jgi:signal transduction histidine kinase/uncharacterized protein YhfF
VTGVARTDAIAVVVQRTAGLVGTAFLRALVREYATAAGARLVYVADHRGDHARVLAEWRDGAEASGGEFVLPGRPPLGPASVTVPLRDDHGAVIGHVGVEGLDQVPTTQDLALFTLLATRTAGEVQRNRYVGTLRARERQLAAARARLVHAVDEERRRIGRDIHDGVQQRTTAVVHLLTLAERKIADDPGSAAALLHRAREEVREATEELRELSHGLRPVGLGDGLGTALEILATRSPVPLHVDELPERRLPEPIENTIYFLCSEAVTNAGKHAGASEVRVSVVQQPDAVQVAVVDDGRGGADTSRGSGLRGLQDRIATLGGALGVDSPPGQGTRLTATIPLAPWRTAREPFLEFGSPEDEGAGRRAIELILSGERTGAISLAREWELEGGVPGIGTRLPIRDYTGREYGSVVVQRVSILPLGQIDESAVAVLGTGETVDEFRAWAHRRWGDSEETLAFIPGDEDWRLTDDEPLAILWFGLEPRNATGPGAAGSGRGPDGVANGDD